MFVFIPVADFWAFYRIKKLRMYLLYVVIPKIAASLIIDYFYLFKRVPTNETISFMYPGLGSPLYVAIIIASIAFHASSIYLVIIWSRRHNQQFDQPTPLSEGGK